MPRASLRRLRLLLWLAVAALVVATGLAFVPRPEGQPGPGELGRGDYRLIATDGSSFTQQALQGHPSLVFFGFTHCPDVCPTTLAEIIGWKEALGPAGKDLRIWFITVDPERDTADVLRAYLSWAPEARGVTGSEQEIAKALRAFAIFARKVPQEGDGYTVDHSAQVLLFDEAGRYSQSFNYREPAVDVVGKLRSFLGG